MWKAFEEVTVKQPSPPVLAFQDFEQPFVVETDASSVVVRAFLEKRKEDKKFYPIEYVSRPMKSEEGNSRPVSDSRWL